MINCYIIDNGVIVSGPHGIKSTVIKTHLSTGNPDKLGASELIERGVFPEWRELVDATLGWAAPVFEPGNERVAVYANGTPEEREAAALTRRKAQTRREIRELATSRIEYHLMGTGEEGDDTLLNALLDIIEVQVDLFRDLKNKGLMTNSDFNSRVIEMRDRIVLYRNVKQSMRDSIQNSVSIEDATAAIDLLIPPPEEDA